MRCSGVHIFQEFLCRNLRTRDQSSRAWLDSTQKATDLVGSGHLEAGPGLAAPQMYDPQQFIPPLFPLLLKEEVGLALWFHEYSEGREKEHSMNLTEQMAYSGQRGSARGGDLQAGQEGRAVLGKAEAVAWKQDDTQPMRLEWQGHNSSVP